MILGTVYALERMMSWSANMGQGLNKFNTLTNISAESLQRWQYAGRQFGASAESVESSMLGVQEKMGDMLIGKGAPEGMAMLADSVGFDMDKAKDTFYVMQKLQEYAVKNKGNATLSNSVLRSFGLSDDVIQAMKQAAFTKERMAKADVFSDKEVGILSKINVEWSNLDAKAKMLMGRLTVAFGPETIKGISGIADEVFKMVYSFAELAKKINLLEGVSMIFEGWKYIFEFISDAIDKVVSLLDSDIGKKVGGWLAEKASGLFDFGSEQAALANSPSARKWLNNADNITARAPNSSLPSKVNNIEIKQNLNFNHDGKDALKTRSSVKSATESAYRQMSAQRQAN